MNQDPVGIGMERSLRPCPNLRLRALPHGLILLYKTKERDLRMIDLVGSDHDAHQARIDSQNENKDLPKLAFAIP
jgi:hypothetical protein